jgi:hypothetical protein
MKTIIEMHTVDEKYIEDEFCEHEFRVKIRHMKIIELKAELEAKQAKYAQLKALIREKQQVDHELERDVICSDCNCSFDKHEASDTDDDDKFIRCAKQESQIPFARHSVISYTSESAHDEPEEGKTNTKVGFFKSLAQFIRTKREEARPRQEILELLFIE